MFSFWTAVLLAVSLNVHCLSSVYAFDPNSLRVLGPQAVNLWKLEQSRRPISAGLLVQESDNTRLQDDQYISGPHWFRQPLDHFDKGNNHTFLQRYWVNSYFYKPGKDGAPAPVIVLDGGETSGEDRLSFLGTGIAAILAKATGGVAVVLEHRYYGESIAVQNLTTDSLRWLDNEQSAADSANFMANVKFDGIDEDLTAPHTPWIYYGGSYAGARAAHMRILYPDLVYGAIASSAVTHASIVNWEYMDIIRKAADPKCAAHLENSINTIDAILAQGRLKRPLKALFGLADIKHDEDFVSLLESPLGSWQAKCWHPDFDDTAFDDFCTELAKPPFGFSSVGDVAEIPYGDARRMVRVGGGLAVDFTIINYAKYIKTHVVSQCPDELTTQECFGTYNDEKYRETDLDQTWRLWLFQVCTQWGYFTTAPPDANYPRIISKLLTLAYESKICKQAFLPGEHFTVPSMPNVTAVNVLGDFDIAVDRLAIIDGEVDPWRPDTPHSDYANDREDTILRPFKVIPNGVHHYDEWGLANIHDEPPEIRKIHEEQIDFVTQWLKDWSPGKDKK